MLLVFVPHPALDKTVVLPHFAVGRTFRTTEVRQQAGGKGYNFARALHRLGGQCLVVGPLAGHIGQMVHDLARAEGILSDPVWVAGETRVCLDIVDASSGIITQVYESGPLVDDRAWTCIAARLEAHVRGGIPSFAALVVCGGFMPGAPSQALFDVVGCAHAAEVPIWLDTYGPQLAAALQGRPDLVKINQHEAADLIGHPIDSVDHALEAARALQERGAQTVVITLGKLGAVGVDAHGAPFGWAAPDTGGMFPVGSGDSLFAGLAWRLQQGAALDDALRLGIAAGAANTLQPGAAVFERDQVEALLARVKPLLV
ncbi:MAG: hexose kinase [Anaerolineae bacterium]|nr:hexose kinase [Thermoflexales bacterium]MDW8408194.1 hexose kinase [Anaerolineae bacterium]